MSAGLRNALVAIKTELDARSAEGEAHLFLNIPFWQLEELLTAHPVEPAKLDDTVRIAVRNKIAEWYGAEYNAAEDAFFETWDGGGVSDEQDENAMHAYRGMQFALEAVQS